jgi:hypothetical protein
VPAWIKDAPSIMHIKITAVGLIPVSTSLNNFFASISSPPCI